VRRPQRLGRSSPRSISRHAGSDQRSETAPDEARARAAESGAEAGRRQCGLDHDQHKALAADLPIAIGILALTTFAILFAMTGSVVLPIKALLMNVLSLSAAFGVLVLIFQDGRSPRLA